jgi:hypothetical protein
VSSVHRTAIVVSLVVCLGRASSISAQSAPEQSDPGKVALRHLQAMLKADWTTNALLTRPDELARNRTSFEPIFLADTSGNITRRVMGQLTQLELRNLSDVDFNARLFAFHVKLASQGSAFERFVDAQIIAVAQPQPDTAYVVWQWKLPAGERPIRGPAAMKLVKERGKWWLDMLTDFEGLRQMLIR